MNIDTLSQLRQELAAVSASVKQCTHALQGFKAFKSSPKGLVFCAEQLRQGAATLLPHAEELLTLAEELHVSLDVLPQQGELDNITMDGQR
jgi:hypothetical protein